MSTLVAAVAALGLLLLFDGIARGADPARASRAAGRLRALAEESGIRGLTAWRLGLWCAGAGSVTVLVVAGITGSAVVAASAALPAALLPVSVARARRDARRRRLREEWPDALAMLVAAVRAGVSLPEACASLADRGPAALRPGATAFTSTYRATGSFAAALTRLQEELADPIADRVATALRLAHEVGETDLVRVLRALADFLREDVRIRKEIEARWSWTVTAARVAAAAPWIVLFLMATRPEAARAYESAAGVLVIGGGALCTVAGYRLMLRAARLPEERRVPA